MAARPSPAWPDNLKVVFAVDDHPEAFPDEFLPGRRRLR
jgi:hypothetical protein